jgi:3-oxoacyl-[acyl-carrier-protein] synthase II
VNRVVITGLGPLTSIGTGKSELWESVIQGKSNVVQHTAYLDGNPWATFPLSKIPHFDLADFSLSKGAMNFLKERELMEDIDLLYLIAAIQLALKDSNISYNQEENDIGLILTHENPGVDRYVREVFQVLMDFAGGKIPEVSDQKELALKCYNQQRKAVYNMQSFMYLHHVSKVFGFHGFSLFINNACASGLYAIEAASQHIRSGRSKVMVVAGADQPLFVTKYLWFKDLGLYAEDGVMRPFDRNRGGFIFGDGGGAVVLEEMEHAMKRGATIWGEYAGGGFNQEAWKVSVPLVTEHFYTKAFEEALQDSGIEAHEIGLINPHGAATGVADQVEARTIREVFPDKTDKPLITAFKPYVGHNLGGSALVELIILLLSMENNMVPPTLNTEEVDPELKIEVNRELTPRELQVVAKMSSGFAGYNAVGIFKKVNF